MGFAFLLINNNTVCKPVVLCLVIRSVLPCLFSVSILDQVRPRQCLKRVKTRNASHRTYRHPVQDQQRQLLYLSSIYYTFGPVFGALQYRGESTCSFVSAYCHPKHLKISAVVASGYLSIEWIVRVSSLEDHQHRRQIELP